MSISQALYKALCLKYESEIATCRATLEIYFNNPVGIGEHPQHLEEMDKLVENMVSNEDKLSSLRLNFSKYSGTNNACFSQSNVNINGNICIN